MNGLTIGDCLTDSDKSVSISCTNHLRPEDVRQCQKKKEKMVASDPLLTPPDKGRQSETLPKQTVIN